MLPADVVLCSLDFSADGETRFKGPASPLRGLSPSEEGGTYGNSTFEEFLGTNIYNVYNIGTGNLSESQK